MSDDPKVESKSVAPPAPPRYCYIVCRKNKSSGDDTEIDYSMGKQGEQFLDRPVISKCDTQYAAQSFATEDEALTFAISWMEDSLKTADYGIHVQAAKYTFGHHKGKYLQQLNSIFEKYNAGDLMCSVIGIKLPV